MFSPDTFASSITAMIPAAAGVLFYQWKNHKQNSKKLDEIITQLKFWNLEFTPHRHVKGGEIIYPHGMANGKERHI